MDVSLIVGGVEYAMGDGTYGWLSGDDGLGMAPLRRLTSRSPQQDGDSDVGWRLDARQFSLVFSLTADTEAGFWEQREQLTRLLHPGAEMVVRFDMGSGRKRDINAKYVGGLTMGSRERAGFLYQKAGAIFRAADPTFYDPTQIQARFAENVGSWAIGWNIPWMIGQDGISVAADLDEYKPIVYYGTYDSYPIIHIHGPIDDPIITNETTGDKLDLTGVSIAADDLYVIDCRWGYKTVQNDAGTNKISELSDDSDLGTFRIVAAVDGSESRTNTIRVQGSSVVQGDTAIYFLFYARYLGI